MGNTVQNQNDNNLMQQRLRGKVAVITGGNSGIGLAAAKLFVQHGAYVYITGRRQEQLDDAVTQIGEQVTPIKGDIANLEDLDRIIAVVKEAHGRIDVLFANAGTSNAEPLGHISEASFDQLFTTNVKGTVFTVQKALALMGPGGSIILTGSVTGSRGTPAMSIYGATKAALRNLARSWALDLKGTGIRVNVLSPGPIATTAVVEKFTRLGQMDAFAGIIKQQSPLGRMGEAEEVAAVALFLASSDSIFMTGSEVFVDGGFGQI